MKRKGLWPRLGLFFATLLVVGAGASPARAVNTSNFLPTLTVTIRAIYVPATNTWTYTIDPANVIGFQGDIQFNSNRLQPSFSTGMLGDIRFLDGFQQQGMPFFNPSQPNLILDIAGTHPLFTAEQILAIQRQDLFEISFIDQIANPDPTAAPEIFFGNFDGPDDPSGMQDGFLLQVLNPDGSISIVPADFSAVQTQFLGVVPEPGSFGLFAASLSLGLAVHWRLRRRRRSK